MFFNLNGRHITVDTQYLLSVQQINAFSVINIGEIKVSIGIGTIHVENGSKDVHVSNCNEIFAHNLNNYRVKIQEQLVLIETMDISVIADFEKSIFIVRDEEAQTPFIMEEK